MMLIRLPALLLLLLLAATVTGEGTSSTAAAASRALLDGIVAAQKPLLESSSGLPLHHGTARSLQNGTGTGGASTCDNEANAAESCLVTGVAEADVQACVSCFQSAQQTALDDLQSDVLAGGGLTCDSIETVVCQPLVTCTCVGTCVDEFEAYFSCQLGATFAASNLTAFDDCQISCGGGTGTGGGGGGSSSGNGTSTGGGDGGTTGGEGNGTSTGGGGGGGGGTGGGTSGGNSSSGGDGGDGSSSGGGGGGGGGDNSTGTSDGAKTRFSLAAKGAMALVAAGLAGSVL